jgi:hypothetical protein
LGEEERMSQKTPEKAILKELGCLQEKVLFYLAKNPEKHKKAIQQGINHDVDQYGSVKKAVDALEKMGYIQSIEALSQKKVPIKFYYCTETGIFYALTKDSTANIPNILNIYESKFPFCEGFNQLYTIWGHDNFVRYLNDTIECLPIIQRKGFKYALPLILMQAVNQTQDIGPKTHKENIEKAIKLNPEIKQTLREWQKSINDLLETS